MALLALVACAPGPDTGAAAVPEGWVFGDVATCAHPIDAAWTLDPTPPETYTSDAAEHGGAEPGGVGIVEVEGALWLLWIPPDAPPRARPLAGGPTVVIGTEIAAGLIQADLDGDGAMDLVLPGGALDIVWGFGTADEQHTERWLRDPAARDVAVLDVDGDGLDDLAVAFTARDHDDREALRPAWLRNEGGRSFGEPEPVGGDPDRWGPAFDLSAIDLDEDGDLDLYLCNDFGETVAPNAVIESRDGALALGEARGLDLATGCMGVAWGDTRGVGELDAYISATARQHLLATAGADYYDTATARGLPPLAETQMGWGAALGDLDNDGRAEFVLATSDFLLAEMVGYPLLWYRQDEDRQFVEEGAARGLPQAAATRGVVARDLNGDGVPELVVGDAVRSPWIWWSDGCTADAWIDVEAPSGSLLTAWAGDQVWTAQVSTDAGWASTGPARAHLGLGNVDTLDGLVLRAPGHPDQALAGPLPTRRTLRWTP